MLSLFSFTKTLEISSDVIIILSILMIKQLVWPPASESPGVLDKMQISVRYLIFTESILGRLGSWNLYSYILSPLT